MSNTKGNYRQHLASNNGWQQVNANSFWGEIASSDHIIQVYEEDEVMTTSVASFIEEGIHSNETCVVILTPEHIHAIEKKLRQRGFNVDTLIDEHRYIPYDAEETLAKFMVEDWPDRPLLYLTVSELLVTAKASGRKIRCMGEMVYLLWRQGLEEATIQLEAIWNELYDKDPFLLYCVYKRESFEGDIFNKLSTICCAHHKIIAGTESNSDDIVYRNLDGERRESAEVLLAR